jgi:two-component system KDP operon response regulator KdpE
VSIRVEVGTDPITAAIIPITRTERRRQGQWGIGMDGCLLLVATDGALRAQLASFLQSVGFQVLTATDGHAGLRLAYEHHPGLVLLDLELPALDGRQVCERLRELSQVPILMLSRRSEEDAVVACLAAGADDFVTVPLHLKELEARVRALLRRIRTTEAPLEPGYDDGRLRIDPQRQLIWRRGSPVHLSPTEFRLLLTLVRQNGRVVPHEDLLSEVWGPHCLDSLSYLSIYVRYLRQKLEDDPNHPQYIQTKWGVGYRFVPR